MEGNAHEYACARKSEGKWLIFKLLLILLYVAYTIGYLYAIIATRFFSLGALIPVTLWILVYFTWRYASPDYKYTIEAGMLRLFVSYGKKTHEKLKIHLKDAVAITPKEEIYAALSKTKVKKAYDVTPSKSEKDVYAIAFKEETKVYILYIKVTRDTLKALYYYNKNTIMNSVSEDK